VKPASQIPAAGRSSEEGDFWAIRLPRWRKSDGTSAWRKSAGWDAHAKPNAGHGPRDMAKAGRLDPQLPAVETHPPCHGGSGQGRWERAVACSPSETSAHRATTNEAVPGGKQGAYVTLGRLTRLDTGSPTGREADGDGAVVVVRGRESRPQGEGPQVR
jgi:hypothetical protein